MFFWICFAAICIMFCILEDFLPDERKKYLQISLIGFLIFISAFRYNIGYDYSSYVALFFSPLDEMSIEPAFNFIVSSIKYLGLDYQMLFVIYALLTMFFLHLGCRYYTGYYVLPIALYGLIPMLYWNNQSIIRQAVAISIIFWGSKYIVEQNFKKYILTVFLAATFHFTAFIMLPFYCIIRKKYSLISYFSAISLSYLFSLFGITIAIVSGLASLFMDEKILFYLTSLTSEKISYTKVIIQFSIFFITLFLVKKNAKDPKINVLLNSYVIGIVIYFSTLDVAYLARIKNYYDIFMVVILFYALKYLCNYRQRIIIKLFLLLGVTVYFLYTLDQISLVYGENIDYRFNFQLW